MPAVRVKENEPFDVALRRFKRSCEKAGVLSEVRRRQAYEKPTSVRKRKHAAAVKRQQKKTSREQNRFKRLYCSVLDPGTNMAESLKEQITADMKEAMRAKDKDALGTIRLIQAAIKQREVDERIELDDSQVLVVLDKMVKQRRDSIKQYQDAGREELAAKEEAEIGIIQKYLPEALSDAEIDALIEEAVSNSGAQSMQDMGKVMGQLKPKLQGRADMGAVSARIKARLSA